MSMYIYVCKCQKSGYFKVLQHSKKKTGICCEEPQAKSANGNPILNFLMATLSVGSSLVDFVTADFVDFSSFLRYYI